MHTDIKVNFPDDVLNNMSFEQNLFSTATTDTMISAYSEVDRSKNVLRVYQLEYNSSDEVYDFVQELAAFSFEERSGLLDFLNDLPGLNGLEMLMLLNPVDRNQELLN